MKSRKKRSEQQMLEPLWCTFVPESRAVPFHIVRRLRRKHWWQSEQAAMRKPALRP
jgi:hypothetical protein